MRGRYSLGIAVVMAVAAGLAMTAPSAAQEWISPEACAVSRSDIDAMTAKLPPAPPPNAPGAMINGIGRAWKVTGPDGGISYLWGTLHSSDRLVVALPPELQGILTGAKAVVLENDPILPSRTAIEETQLQPGMWLAPSEPPYEKTFLDPSLKEWARARLVGLGLGEGALERLTDAGLGVLLLSDPCEDFAAGVLPVQDHRLLLAAYERDIPYYGLDARDAFVNEMSQSDRAETAEAIATIYASYLNPDGFREARIRSFTLYRQGRIGEMMDGDRSYLTGFFGAMRADALRGKADGFLLAERNARFLRAMKKHLDEGGALIAVGAFHLPGPDGLIEGLRAAGYKVERITTAGEV